MDAIVILGPSRSGKDTTFGVLCKTLEVPLVNIKFSGPMKRVLEYMYVLPEGSMEDPGTRASEVPGLPGVTFLDLMVRCYHAWPLMDPRMGMERSKEDVRVAQDSGVIPVFTDVRKDCEAQYIRESFDNPWVIRLYRDSSVTLESDRFIDSYERLLGGAWTLINNGTIESLENSLRSWVGSGSPTVLSSKIHR
jgi:hypothetical protein